MPEPYEIIHTVHDFYKKACEKLARLNGKTKEIYKSHGREPKSHNPLASGNTSPVTHYFTYVRQYEAVEPGAGVMLNNRVHAALDAEFIQNLEAVDQGELHEAIIDETCDVQKWLAKFDLEKASLLDIKNFQRECREGVDALLRAEAQARSRQRLIETERANARNVAVIG
jgi:hypothetical protein